PARPAGRISALTLLKRHGLSLSVVARKYAARGPRNKKPGAVSRPGCWRTFGEYAFLEDSRYASQEVFAGNLVWRRFLRFYRGIRRSAWKARVHGRGRSPAEVCLQGLIRNHLLSLSLIIDSAQLLVLMPAALIIGPHLSISD